jgi:DNA-binding LacI/PurR family transcriptional regulator
MVVSGGPASELVAERTRNAVLEAAAELGYVVNVAARSLQGGRNRMLGVYTFEPVFAVDEREVPGEELSYVAADYVGATRDVTRSLTRLGHRRLAYVKVADDKEWTRDRESGFRQGIEEAGIAAGDVHMHTLDEVSPAIEEWLAAGITAVLVEPSQDDTAISAVERAATRAGVSIPRDLSVVLLGDPPLVNATARDWARFSIPREQMGREAVRLLLELLDDEPGAVRQLYLDCIPVAGDSVAEPRPGAEAPR